jgi:glycopeptide antibiotics resistance protein
MQSFTKFKKFVWLALLLPVGVELTQFLVSLAMRANWRAADIDDVILNMGGMIIGYFILKLFLRVIKRFTKLDFLALISGKKATLEQG